jgi:hypothetical protein
MPRTRTAPDAGDGPNDDVASAPTSAAAEGLEPVAGQPQPAGDLARHEYYADQLRNNSAAVWHHAAMATKIKGVDPQSYILYHERLRADCGGTDPIEVMLIEEIAQAHACLGLLFAKTSNGGHVEAVGIYSGAAARVMGEVRRSALALQAYRAASRQLAHDPTRDLIVPDRVIDPDGDAPGKNRADDEQGMRAEEPDADDAIIPYPEPAACGPQGAPASEVPAQSRGARKAPRGRSGDAALGDVHRTANG